MNENKPELCLIWAQDVAGTIGREGDIPWRSKKDFVHFRKLTRGNPVIMGYKTWEALPHRPLSGQLNIVISSQPFELDGALVAPDLPAALALAREETFYRAFLIGGGNLFSQALPQADRVFRTIVGVEDPDADCFAPALDDNWTLLKQRSDCEDGVELHFSEFAKRSLH